MLGTIESNLVTALEKSKALLFILLDPDSASEQDLLKTAEIAGKNGADAILIGGSFIPRPDFQSLGKELKQISGLPIILFPGGSNHVSAGVDAVLFTTLISGRNPQYLIDEQVRGAVLCKKLGLETLPTAYMLIESGKMTAVEFVSNTKPLPSDKPSLSAAHAIAAEALGLRWVYLEAGSGALNPVPLPIITAVRKSIGLKIMVGGGIRSPEQARDRVSAGADIIVIGNHFEACDSLNNLKDYAQIVHEG